MLFFRPVNVCITALTQLERPRMTRAVARGDHDAAIRSERVFMAALVMLWLASCAVAAIALYAFPGLILKPTLDHRLVMIAGGLSAPLALVKRTDARRVGNEGVSTCGSGWSQYHTN